MYFFVCEESRLVRIETPRILVFFFVEEDKLVIGICNGCQILINLGIVPASEGYKREMALVENDIPTYQCRWVNIKVINQKSPWLKKIEELYLPVAHQEGKFIAEKKVVKSLIKKKINLMQIRKK